MKSWTKQNNESDASYARFSKFLDFDGTLVQFAAKECPGVSLQAIKLASSKHNWKARKNDYLKHTQELAQEAVDENTRRLIAKVIEPFETSCVKLAERLSKIVENDDEIIEALPPSKALDGLRAISNALRQFAEFKEKIGTNTDKATRIVPRFVVEED